MKFEELRGLVGKDVGTSPWYTIGQDRIDQFANTTEDRQFIHVDPEQARATPFGQTIAHGFLTLSMLAPLSAEVLPRIDNVTFGLNYGFNTVRFLNPVKSGQRIRGRFALLSLEEKKPRQWLQTFSVTVEIEGEESPALVAEWLILALV